MMNAWDWDGVCEIALWELDWIGLDGLPGLVSFLLYILLFTLSIFILSSFLFIYHWYSTTMYLVTFSLSIYLLAIIQMSFEALWSQF